MDSLAGETSRSESTDESVNIPKRKGHQGLKANVVALDKEVWLWYRKSAMNNQNLTKCDVQNYARNIYLQANIQNFKASDGWYRRWRHRWMKNGDAMKTKMELQDSDLVVMEGLNFAFPDFDENLFSIGKPDLLLKALESLEKEKPKKHYHESIPTRKPAQTRIKGTIPEKQTLRKGVRYRPEFKEKVVAHSVTHSFNESALKYKIHPTTVSNWAEGKQKPVESESVQKSSIEEDFAKWLQDLRLSKRQVSKEDVQEEVTKIKARSSGEVSKWFLQYYSRLYDGMTSNIQYPQVIKTEVVKLAELWSQKYISSILNISRKQIYNWSKESHPEHAMTRVAGRKDDVGKCLWDWYMGKDLKPLKKEIHRQAAEIARTKGYDLKITKSWLYKWCNTYNVTSNSLLDKQLLEWILKRFDQNSTPSQESIRRKCAALHKNIYGETNFKASRGWVERFCKRHSDLLQNTPTPSTALPEKCESCKDRFKATLLKVISKRLIPLDRIGILDESALRLASAKKVKRSLRVCSFKNIEGSFVFSCLANGCILPLLIILRGPQADPERVGDVFVAYHETGALDSATMQFWAKNCVGTGFISKRFNCRSFSASC
ncbi:unnamed protein product [Bemisia tabaci]|uniref:HTH CENPB-type domain-containing protein n=1 Tax=Bemisia tabaci TaxID=7038 RepID=A0A9P0F6N1_BEMTA|nr:unnamed protein product [Bemisia tabaci]